MSEKKISGDTSDGFHTFDDLYYQRMCLFAVICNTYKDKSWKSWRHSDGSMFADYFIAGVNTPQGQFTYHYHKRHWGVFDVKVVEFAPEWDGHTAEDITRLFSIIEEARGEGE